MTEKKNLFLSAAIAIVVVIILVIAFFPKGRNDGDGPDVISKRVKLNLIDETAKVDEQDMKPGTGASAQNTAAEPSTPAKDVSTLAPAPAAGPGPATGTAPAAGSAPEAAPATVVAKPAPIQVKRAPAPAAKHAVKKKTVTASLDKSALAAKKPWAINVASFPNRDGALKLSKALNASGYNAYVTVFELKGRTWNRVRVGFYDTRETATQVGNYIRKKYRVQDPWVVKPSREETSEHIRR